MPLQPIEDPADPRVAAYLNVRDRDLLGHGGRFVAEGGVVLRVLLSQSRFPVESVLVAAGQAEALAPLLADLPESVPVYVARAPVLDGIVGFHLHRGILAIGRREAELEPRALLRGLGRRALVVGLVGIANHDNMGGIFRNAAAFGVDAVLLDRTCCDPLYRKAIRVSVGASLVVPFARGGSASALLDDLFGAGIEPIGLSPHGSQPLAGLERPDRAAVILGAEGPGLPREILARIATVRIPMAGGFDSLNVATASGIALHHLAVAEGLRPRPVAAAPPPPIRSGPD